MGVQHGSEYATTLGNRPVKKFTGEYTMNGEQVYTDGTLLVDTVRRFKGKQASIVILTDMDLSEGDRLDDRQRVAFVGMTRATLGLYMVTGTIQ